MERLANRHCPRCGRTDLNIYVSENTDEKLGAWCENRNLKAYYDGDEMISMNYS